MRAERTPDWFVSIQLGLGLTRFDWSIALKLNRGQRAVVQPHLHGAAPADHTATRGGQMSVRCCRGGSRQVGQSIGARRGRVRREEVAERKVGAEQNGLAGLLCLVSRGGESDCFR